jgi:predicted ribosome quality control (RQC) complex YloA/Tae2 family protein
MITKTIRFPNINGLEINYYIGKSAKENFEIIDAAMDHHLWFHVEGEPSGHVIAEMPDTMNKKYMRYIVKQGAVLCKQHSKYSSQPNCKIVYTNIEYVNKSDKLGSVTISNSKTITI